MTNYDTKTHRPLIQQNSENFRQSSTLKMKQFQIQSPSKQSMLKKNKKTIQSQPQTQYLYPTQQQYCYPKFLDCLGSCITPFLAIFPCCRCGLTSPLFQQVTSNVGILQKFGRYQQILNPGLNIINPISQTVIQISQKTKVIQFRQNGYSRDNVQFELVAVVLFRVVDSVKLVYRLGSTDFQLFEFVQEICIGTLRNIIGENLFQEAIQKRQLLGQMLKDQVNKVIKHWGIYIETAAIKDMILPKQISEILANVSKTRRLIEAKLINYQAEVQCAKLIKQISELLSTPSAFQIRYLNTLGEIIQNRQDKLIILKTSNPNDYEKLQ